MVKKVIPGIIKDENDCYLYFKEKVLFPEAYHEVFDFRDGFARVK